MIVHVITNLHALSGGPTTAVVELARQQGSGSEPVRLILDEPPRDTPGVSGDAAAIAARWSGLDVAIHAFAGDAPGSRIPRWQIRRHLADLRPRIVHLHGVWDPIVRRTASACTSLGVPWVLSSHGMLHPFAMAKGGLKKSAYLAAFPRAVGAARAVLALNAEEAAAVQRRFRVPAIVAPTGIETGLYRREPDGSFARSVRGLGSAPFVLFLGRLDPIKGTDLLVESFSVTALVDAAVHLVIAGPDFGAESGLRAQVGRLGLDRRVHLVGTLSGDRKLAALAECAIFAHRPRYEGFGIAVVEAMASGRPVVTTAACRLDGAAAAGAILECPDRAESFGEAIVSLLRDPVSSGRLASAGRTWVEQNLGWPAILGVTERAYRS